MDKLSETQATAATDEVSFFIPSSWKEVLISFNNNAKVSLNDPRAKFLRIDFLKREFIPLPTDLPIAIFFPIFSSKTLNPETISLAMTDIVGKKNAIPFLAIPLLVRDVSRLFLDVVKDNLEFVIIATSQPKKHLNWSLEVIDQEKLEEDYIIRSQTTKPERPEDMMLPKLREEYLRQRFRGYVKQMSLYTQDEQKLLLTALLQGKQIILTQI